MDPKGEPGHYSALCGFGQLMDLREASGLSITLELRGRAIMPIKSCAYSNPSFLFYRMLELKYLGLQATSAFGYLSPEKKKSKSQFYFRSPN